MASLVLGELMHLFVIVSYKDFCHTDGLVQDCSISSAFTSIGLSFTNTDGGSYQ